MLGKIKWSIVVMLAIVLGGCSCNSKKSDVDTAQDLAQINKDDIISIIKKVNDKWQSEHDVKANPFWHHAAYHAGNMAAYKLTRDSAYLQYSKDWADYNNWIGAGSTDTSKWKYSYGETPEYVLFADWQACFQVYADLYQLEPAEEKIARAKEVMEYQMSTPQNDYWWWADGLFMGMPVMTRLYKITNDEVYLDKLYAYFSFARDLMLDTTTGLLYRDAKYIYPAHKTNSGEKDFWARGNGWVITALARVLDDLPLNDVHREEYISIYKNMARALVKSQQSEGYWTRSMLDVKHAPGPETSGTAFFTYGILWGLNNQVLDEATYAPVVAKSWNYLSKTAVQQNGVLGFVQPIGEKAIPGQIIDVNSTADFGVGAFLLAAAELAVYIKK